MPTGEMRVMRDVPYRAGELTDYESERCRMDLFLPEGRTNFPMLLWLHGGGLTAGDKTEAEGNGALRFVREGIGLASANYRFSPVVTYPAYLEDAAAAVASLAVRLAGFGANPRGLVLTGHSAGAYLAAQVAMDPQYLAAHRLSPDILAGVAPICGQMVTHFTVRNERGISREHSVIDEAAPCYHARSDAPPVCCMVGGDDIPTRPEENRYFIALLRAAGHPRASYHEYPGRDHGTMLQHLGDPDDAVANTLRDFVFAVTGAG